MYWKLGDIQFTGAKTLQAKTQVAAAKFSEMSRIDQKPTLQRTGDELEQLAIVVRLHRGFSDLQADLALFNRYLSDGQILPLTDGEGTRIGVYVIRRITRTEEISDLQGRPISISLEVELSEFVDANPALTAELQAANAGFATSADRVIPITVARLGSTAQAATVQSIQTADLNSLAAVADIEKAAIAPSQKAALFAQAGERMNRAIAGAEDAVRKLQDFQSLAAKAPDLLATMQAVAANANLLKQRITEGDLTNALAQANTMTASLDAVSNDAMPLKVALILRES